MSERDRDVDSALLAGLPRVSGTADWSAMSASMADAFVDRVDADVAYASHETPVGMLRLVTTPAGVVRIAFEETEDIEAVMQRIASEVSPRMLREPAKVDPLRRQLDEYFSGARQTFDVPIDLRLSRGFRHEVLEHLRAVPFGTTVSYATLAEASGRPRAVRAAASACATNPVPIVVPCHRVVRADGSMGGYLGGIDAKRTLLALESSRA